MNIEIMKYYFAAGLWSLERLNKLLAAGKITKEEFDAVRGSKK